MEYKPVSLPADGNAHKNIIEWWYFNGHLKDKEGNRYSFMDCLFQADLKRVNLPFLRKLPFKKYAANFLPYVNFAHSVVSDIGRQINYKDMQTISLLSRDSFKRSMLFANYIDPLIVFGYANHEIVQTSAHENTVGDTFHVKTEKIDLQLTAKKPGLLEQGKGLIDVCGRKSYYYSYTDLEARGTINLEGKIIEVEGKAWMGHQWADVAYGKDKWTWFSVQLENGTDIMLAEYDDHINPAYLVDIMEADGKTKHSQKAEFIPSTDKDKIWQSPRTKAKYPLAWQVKIPENNITIDLKASMKDQEMIYGAINYYEGPLEVTAKIDGKTVRGVGFMELVGFPSDYNFVLLAMKDLRKSLRRKIFRGK